MVQEVFNYPAEQVKALSSSFFPPYLAINGGAQWHLLYLFCFLMDDAARSGEASLSPCYYPGQTCSEAVLLHFRPPARGAQAPLLLAEVSPNEKAELPGVVVTNSLSRHFLSPHLHPEPPKTLSWPSWPGFMAGIFPVLLNRAIFLLSPPTHDSLGLFSLLYRQGN